MIFILKDWKTNPKIYTFGEFQYICSCFNGFFCGPKMFQTDVIRRLCTYKLSRLNLAHLCMLKLRYRRDYKYEDKEDTYADCGKHRRAYLRQLKQKLIEISLFTNFKC